MIFQVKNPDFDAINGPKNSLFHLNEFFDKIWTFGIVSMNISGMQIHSCVTEED